MSREEALNDWLPIIRQMVKGTEVYTEALDMAIKALEQEPCDDAVSRQVVLDTIWDVPDYDDGMVWEALSHAQRGVALLPSVTPQPKMGRWIDDKCSECGKGIEDLIDSPEWYRNEEPNFCPFCGIKMEKVGDDRK